MSQEVTPHEPAVLLFGNDPEVLLTEEQAAAFLAVKRSTLKSWRYNGQGPEYVEFNAKSIRYRRGDLMAFVKTKKCRSTAESAVSRKPPSVEFWKAAKARTRSKKAN